MTSGVFRSIDISTLWVDRSTRQRQELKNIPELAESINRRGLIHAPIVQRETLELIAGERRWEACKLLGWTSIPVQFVDEVDPLVLKSLELEENIRREDITWQERTSAIAAFHEIKLKSEPGWTAVQTADELGVSKASIGQHLAVAEEIKINPKIAEAERFSIAKNITERAADRRAQAEKERIIPREKTREILNEDFSKWSLTYSGPKFNFIHCDFPYGINADKQHQGTNVQVHGGYADSEDIYWALLESFALNLDNFAAPQAHLMFWFSMKFYSETIEFFKKKTDFKIDAFPLIWHKSDSIGLLPDSQRGPRRVVETCLFGARGDRKIVRAVDNGVSLPTTGAVHMSEKPVPVLAHFFRMIVDGTTSILDPTCGSGTAIRAAEAAGAGRVLGLEINKEFSELAEKELVASRRKIKVTAVGESENINVEDLV